MAMEPIRRLTADDHAGLRAGLRLLLDGQEDMQVVDEAGDGWQTVDKAVSLKPDIVLLDITMPGLSGLEAARQFPQMGAAGYIVKKAADTELVAAIRAVNRGESFIHPSLTLVLIEGYLQQPPPVRTKESAEELTPRETEVLRLVAQGYTSQQIAQSLTISVTTVETHRAHIMEKLGLRGRAQLFRYAVSRGLLNPDEP